MSYLNLNGSFINRLLYNITVKNTIGILWILTIFGGVVLIALGIYSKRRNYLFTMLKEAEKYDKLIGYLVTDPWGKTLWMGEVFKHIFKAEDDNILNILNNDNNFLITEDELAVINDSFKNSSSGYLDVNSKLTSLDNTFRLSYTRINNVYIWQVALIKSQPYLKNALFVANNMHNLNFAFVCVEVASNKIIYYNHAFKNLFNLKDYNYNNNIDKFIIDDTEDNLEYKEENIKCIDDYGDIFSALMFRTKMLAGNKEYYSYIVLSSNLNVSQDNKVLYQAFDSAPIGMFILNNKDTLSYLNHWLIKMFSLKDTNNLTIPLMLNNTAVYFDLKKLKANKVTDVDCYIANQKRSFKFLLTEVNNTSFGYVLDITKVKSLESQIKLSEGLQTVGQIASAVAHDFNNLLTAIMSFTYFAQEQRDENDPSMAELEQIKINANRAKIMIKQLLTFSRKQDLQPVEFDVNSEISDLMTTIVRLMGEKVKASFIRGIDVGNIFMDKVQFQQVITNLVINAKDAMKIGGNLQIITYKKHLDKDYNTVLGTTILPDNYVVIEVKDEGEGIKDEHLKLIFNSHFSTKGEKGNGLGLSTVNKIIADNAGFVDVHTKLNKGTSFYMYLPKVIPGAAKIQDNLSFSNKRKDSLIDNMLDYKHNEDEIFTHNAEAKAEKDNKGEVRVVKKQLRNQSIDNKEHSLVNDLTGNEIILLVEDELPVRMVCARHLRNKGYTVLEAIDGEDALEQIKSKKITHIDLIISDVMMPNIGGPELISQVREIFGNVKAMLISGYTEDVLQDINKDTRLKDIVFLAKPFLPDTLAAKVKQALGK